MPSPTEATAAREDVRFESGGEPCAGWLFRPAQAAAEVPCVVLAQVPHTSGFATLGELGPSRMAKLTGHALIDGVGGLLGRSPHYIPTVGPPGSIAAMTGDDAARAYPAMYPDGFEWHNEVAARIMLSYGLYSPGGDAAKVNCPILVQVGTEDHITPPAPAIEASERAPRGELLTYPLSHFEIYRGEPFERAIADQLEFLERHVSGGGPV